MKDHDFTKGPITGPLIKFAFPVLVAMFIQSLYGAVDLFVVGQFCKAEDISAVANGSQIMMTITNLVCSFSIGTTVVLGQMLGQGRREEAGRVIGSAISLFAVVGVVMSLMIIFCARPISVLMKVPEEALALASDYIRICGIGFLAIIAYNLLSSIFRGIGDSITPLITVIIACIVNIIGDLLFVAVFRMGTAGAAVATVVAQALSVVISLLMIARKTLPFRFSLRDVRFSRRYIAWTSRLGIPVALQDLLVGLSFLVVQAFVNDLGLMESSAVGVAEKVCAFIMLVPSAFSQAMSAFAAQNFGANRYDRARTALKQAIWISVCCGIVMFFVNFFFGNVMSGIFSKDEQIITLAADYLKAYAIDCLLTCFLFCFLGFFNGIGLTRFVMIQGMIGAFLVRVPISYFMSRRRPVSLFLIGLATPCSTLLQITMCFACLWYANRRYGRE